MPLMDSEIKQLIAEGYSDEEIMQADKELDGQLSTGQGEQYRKDRFQLKSKTPYQSYGYGDAALDTLKTLVNSVADLGQNVSQPFAHPIQTVKGVGTAIAHPVETVQGIGQYLSDRYGSMDKIAETVSSDPIGFGSDVVSAVVGAKALGSGAVNIKNASKLVKIESTLEKAGRAKVALDGMRDTLGKAKEVALQSVGELPAELDWSGNVSKKVVSAIQDPIYKVEFTPEGGVKGTIGNLDKVKLALNDILSKKDFVEAGNMEKRQIMEFAGRVRHTIVKAADDAGHPELGKALSKYHDFMEKYNPINDHLTDKYGNALGNKLKVIFKTGSEDLYQKQWKELSKSSPELKSIMRNMQTRELLKNLLKITAVAEGGKKLISGNW